MFARLGEIYKYRELFWRWTLREMGVRYKQSLMGIAWAVLQPVAMMVILTLVFSLFARLPTGGVPYPVFAYTALLPWTFVQTAVSFGVPSLINNLSLVTKIYFPREVLPIGAVGASALDFLVASCVYVLMLLAYGQRIYWTVLWTPLILALQVVLTIGVTLLGSAVIVRFRDVRFVVPLALQLWMYASPVVYPLSLVPEQYRSLYMLNPLAGIISSYRRVILYGDPPVLHHLGLAALMSCLLFFTGYVVFVRFERSFADII